MKADIERWRNRVEAVLDAALPSENTEPKRLHQAMRYSTLGGGKRIRACLVYASGALFNAPEEALDAAAAAVEMTHAYSLIHDDLPAMDNDDVRRGKPTLHIAFDEATAILAGDALQTQAYLSLTQAEASDAVRIATLRCLAEASGASGMCGGQQMDMDATNQVLSLKALEALHALKTGALIRASVRMGALIGNANADELATLDQFANMLGLSFQIRDDILDIEASSEQLGKTAGKDIEQNKSTYPRLLGMNEAKKLLDAHAEQMQASLSSLKRDTSALSYIAAYAANRSQ
ncbi:MAG TPA: polyprenyl synthetase family protein [Arenimonas sp.]|mgnify:FL=1|nr:polyprenyl synthetase family protein [Arenimonas sp.]